MLISDHEALRKQIKQWVHEYGKERTALIPVLQEIQTECSFISEYAMQEVADQLGIHPVEVYGVVTFYSFLESESQGRFIVRLCQTISCDMAGKARVARQLVNDLGVEFGETTADGMFTLQWANCLGMCDQGPAMLINDKVYTKVTPEKVHDIIEDCRHSVGASALQRKEGHLV